MYLAGAFDPFWFWTVTYAREYVTMIPVSIGVLKLEVQGLRIVGTAPAEWLLVAIGATAVWWDHATRRRAAFLLSFTAFSFLAVVTGWRFDEHYFVLLLPAASLLSGAGVSALTRALAARRADLAPAVGLALPLLAATLCLLQDRGYFFSLSPIEISRAIYGTNPFIEAVEIARYVREHSDRDDRIAVIGSEPEIYFYAQRRAATSYIYMYPLMEPQPFARAMQEKMIAEIEAAQPRFLVLVNVDQSWSRRSDSAQTVLEWTQQEANADYDTVGVAEIMPDGGTVYRWGAAARTFEPRSRSYVTLLERTAARPGADRLSAATRAERAPSQVAMEDRPTISYFESGSRPRSGAVAGCGNVPPGVVARLSSTCRLYWRCPPPTSAASPSTEARQWKFASAARGVNSGTAISPSKVIVPPFVHAAFPSGAERVLSDILKPHCATLFSTAFRVTRAVTLDASTPSPLSPSTDATRSGSGVHDSPAATPFSRSSMRSHCSSLTLREPKWSVSQFPASGVHSCVPSTIENLREGPEPLTAKYDPWMLSSAAAPAAACRDHCET